jgi:hypothetical protein
LAASKIVVVFEGNISRLHSGNVVVKKGRTWGEQFLTSTMRNKTIDEELIMDSDGVVAEIPFDHVSLLLGGRKLDQVIQQN